MAPSEFLATAAPGVGTDTVSGAPPGTRNRARTNSSVTQQPNGPDGMGPNDVAVDPEQADMQNARAVEVLERVVQKLTGRDFKPAEELDVVTQVDKLINEAIKLENLCQHYIGWCSFW
jgi:FKBP12-rapamycin complex-associated protein